LLYICMRGNRSARKTRPWPLRAVRLLNSDGWRVPAANPRFLPTTSSCPSWRQSSHQSTMSCQRHQHAPPPHGIRIREQWWEHDRGNASGWGQSLRGRAPRGNLTADCKARLPLRSSAKIAMKASGRACPGVAAPPFPAFRAEPETRPNRGGSGHRNAA